MIDKQEYYHGAALIRLLEDTRCASVKKHAVGYIINDEVIVLLKYRTNNRTPWRFSFTLDEMISMETLYKENAKIVIALVCGGDGVCTIHAEELHSVMGDNPEWIAVRRSFNEKYGVEGPKGRLPKKIALRRWPSILFEPMSKIKCRKD